ncbi:MAG TPA: histidinol dehydrogenase [Vicinamibacterales bacterium]|nr:histidinol dehydrogenase [Vicinamibacterales bacterium]
MIQIISSRNAKAVDRLLSVSEAGGRSTAKYVAAIVSAVKRRGDRALLQYARRFDGLREPLEVSRDEIEEGAARVPPAVRAALAAAARNIRKVARRQRPGHWTLTTAPGVSVEQRVTPLDRVGCYVPGGRYPLPSSLLMTAIPARAAGVPQVVVACPRPAPIVMAAARIAGVDRLFRMGGAHAIAALAYGTMSVPRVDKIVGPGNRFVAAAKALVASDCAIDFYAGPTEIVIVSERGNPRWIAADLIAQAEHDPEARAILMTSSKRLAANVMREVAGQLRSLTGQSPAREALSRCGGIILARDASEAVDLANRAAPEHLVCDDEKTAGRVRCAGAIFIGSYTAQVAGDYAIGSNHVLPTNGAARFRGGLNAADFVRVSTVQRMTPAGLRALAPTIVTLARQEGLEGHARSIEVRRR